MDRDRSSMNAVWNFFVNGAIGSRLIPSRLRAAAYGLVGLDVARSALIYPRVFFWGKNVSIGEGTFVNSFVRVATSGRVSIGAHCDIAPFVAFAATSHDVGPPSRRAGALTVRPVTVGDGTWIGTQALILPGVAIGAGCVIGAGAVVTRDCEPNGFYAGNPARRIKDLDPAPSTLLADPSR